MRNELFKGINKMGNIGCFLLVTDKGIMMNGNDIEARAMLSHIVYQLKEHGIDEVELKRAYELGLMSDKERDEVAQEKLGSLIEKLFGGKL